MKEQQEELTTNKHLHRVTHLLVGCFPHLKKMVNLILFIISI